MASTWFWIRMNLTWRRQVPLFFLDSIERGKPNLKHQLFFSLSLSLRTVAPRLEKTLALAGCGTVSVFWNEAFEPTRSTTCWQAEYCNWHGLVVSRHYAWDAQSFDALKDSSAGTSRSAKGGLSSHRAGGIFVASISAWMDVVSCCGLFVFVPKGSL